MSKEVLEKAPEEVENKGVNSLGSTGRPKGSRSLTQKPVVRFTTKVRKKFLEHLSKHGNFSDAAVHAGISRHTAYSAMTRDPKFKDRVEIAKERCVANLEKELTSRIYDGNVKSEYGADGALFRKTVTHDNNLLIKALEANAPEKYGKKSDVGDTTIINVGDSAISKLAAFLKIDLPSAEKSIEGTTEESEEDDIEDAEWEEYDNLTLEND